MNKFVKIGAIVAAVVLVLVVAVVILAKILITPERVRATVVPVAEKALEREVHLGEIEVRLLTGIALHDLRIKEKDSDETFVSAGQVRLRYRFWPLLFLQVVVDEVRLEDPQIRVVRLADGTFNFSDLLGETPEEAQTQPVAASPDTGSASAAPPINLTIATVRLSGGELLFVDQMINPDAPMRYQISQLNFAARDIALDRAFPFELEARINDAPLSVEGRADVLRQTGNARINLDNLDVTAFSPYFREQLPGRLTGLKLGLDVRAEGGADQLTSSGKVALRDLSLTLDDLPDAPIRGANLLLDYDLSADLAASILNLRSSRIDYNGIIAEASGRIEQFDAEPRLAMDLRVPSLDLRKALAALPSALVADVKELDPAGVVDVRARLEGAADQGAALLKNAEVRLQDVQATAGGMRPALNGRLNLDGDRLESQDLVMRAAGNQARIDLKASNLFGEPIVVSQHISADRFDLDALLQAAAGPAAATAREPAPQATAPAEEIGPFDLPLRADGTVKIGQTVYKGLTINDFDLAYRLVDNILTLEKMTGRVVGGTFNQTARVDLGREGLAYQGKVNLQSLQADPFVSAFFPQAAGSFFGNLNLDLDLNGRGTLPETLKQNLSGKGRINLLEGRITGAGLAEGLANFLNLEDLRVLRFSKFGGSFTIEQGRVRLNTDLEGSEVRMKPQGSVGLDGSLDLNLNASLAPNLMQRLDQRGQVTRFLTDQQGWGQLPLRVAGNYDQPRFALDTTGVREQVEERAREELQRRVIDRVLPPKPEEGEEKPQDPARRLLDDAVRGIFGR
ncbi:AsmA family protein [Geoalkalibacter halelectricus]|uniref:AsmA family protein n=1 Tax=Geoalkalibacter halelectricus TaxID=2847045 RepID=A0ABY5ZKM7_9BACT|nr:AsmA family protein [Geoalkalibacter halelectricus]MDO3376566.1 AsmA family protein [Geoalkalibacter halelectricus]UWZ78470.1 AsmA family protein [Geoalkalibacter halelectricus]